MMENKISYEDERKMTNAIESAATLASNDASRNRSETLAGQLKEAGVDPRFAKVASAAFNKRLTVLTFKKTADEHKADPFELADGDKVLELMTGESQQKAASLEIPFEITYTNTTAGMQKAASEEVKSSRPLYEDTVRYEGFARHVESIMEKNAAALQDLIYVKDEVESKADALSTELADYFMKSACASFEFDTLVNAYGDRFKNAIAAKLPENTEFTKTASGAITPDTPLYRKASDMISAHETAEDLKYALDYYGAGLSQFCKAAAFMGDIVQKMELGMNKEAISASTAKGLGIAGETLSDTPYVMGSALPGVVEFGDSLVRGVGNTAGNAFQNAYALYQAGNAAHMAPNEILDAEFLTKDRYRDRLLGWSDMTADPQFSMYPAEQVFMATQKAMDMDTTLERPDRREVLRAYVAQMLSQNNRMSTADIAALAQTLRGLSSSDEHGAQQIALNTVRPLEEKRAPELPNLKPILEGVKEIPTGTFSKAIDDVEKSIKETGEAIGNRYKSEEAKAKEEEAKAEKDQAKAEKEQKELAAAKEKQEQKDRQFARDLVDAQQKRLAFIRNLRPGEVIEPVINPTTKEVEYWASKYQFSGKGRNRRAVLVSQGRVPNDIIEAELEVAEKNNIVPYMPTLPPAP